eukprot:2016977-Prymnesium_polylepis.1
MGHQLVPGGVVVGPDGGRATLWGSLDGVDLASWWTLHHPYREFDRYAPRGPRPHSGHTKHAQSGHVTGARALGPRRQDPRPQGSAVAVGRCTHAAQQHALHSRVARYPPQLAHPLRGRPRVPGQRRSEGAALAAAR